MCEGKYILKILVTCTALLWTGWRAMAQDIHVSQFYETPLMRNPALAGIFTGDVRVQVLYRNQWNWSGFPFKTMALSGEYKFPVGGGNDYLTAGLQAYNDIAGDSRLKTTQVMPALNFHKSLSNERSEFLSVGFMAGMVQRQFDAHNLTFDYQYVDGNYNPGNATGEDFAAYNRRFMDVAAGISYNNEAGEEGSYYLGVSLAHVNKPAEIFQQQKVTLPSKFQFNAGLHLLLDERINMRTELNYSRQGGFNELMVGALVGYELSSSENYNSDITTTAGISAGLFARLNDAIVPVVKLSYLQWELGFSYDVTTSDLKTVSGSKGGYELSLSYKGFTRSGTNTDRIRCPRF